MFLLCFFQANAATNSWYYDSKGPQFQFNRFLNGCYDLQGKTGLNPQYIGECGDLRQADLSQKTFSGANFNGADLRGAQLQNSDFTKADFRAADLRYANWENTKFSQSLINSETKLPFDASYAKKLNMWDTKYSELDRMLSQETTNWLKSPGQAVPPSVIYYISLDADYLYSYGKLIHESLKSCTLLFIDYLVKNRNFPINGTYQYFRPYFESAMTGCKDLKDSLAQVHYLLSQGADPNLVVDSETPLWLAVSYGYSDIAETLIKAGAKVDIERDGTNLIALAALNRRAFLMPLLLAAGLDVNKCKLQGNPCSTLELAISKNDKDAIKFLLSVKADASISYNRPSLLDYFDDIDSIDLLINAGANIKTATIHNRTHEKTIEYLVQKGANIDSRDKEGSTLLIKGMKSRNFKLVDLALKLKADINAKNKEGLTVLSWSFKDPYVRKDWFQKLLDLGADSNVPFVLNGHYANEIRIVASVDAVLSNNFDRYYSYFMPMARKGLKLNEIQTDAPTSNANRYILAVADRYMSKVTQAEIEELQKLGADLSIRIKDRQVERPSSKIISRGYNQYFLTHTEATQVDVSMAWALSHIPEFLQLYSRLGYDISGPQTTRGDYLIHKTIYTTDQLESYLQNGLSLNTLNPEGQNLYFYYNGDETWDSLKSHKIPLIKEDKEGTSLLAFVVRDICSAKTVEKIKELIAQGANPQLISKKYNLSLAQAILANVDREADVACAKMLLTALKNNKLEFNSQWNMQLEKGEITQGFGTLMLMLGSGWSGLLRNIELNDSTQTSYVNLIKFIVSMGYKPELEEQYIANGKQKSDLLQHAYGLHFMDLVIYLKSRGFKDKSYKFEDSKQYNPPANACEMFPKSKTHKPFEQGCLSTSTGLIWSVSEKAGESYDSKKHYYYCKSLPGAWTVPPLQQLMLEHFSKSAKSGLFGYGYNDDKNFFDLSKGRVKKETKKENIYYLCVKPAYSWQ